MIDVKIDKSDPAGLYEQVAAEIRRSAAASPSPAHPNAAPSSPAPRSSSTSPAARVRPDELIRIIEEMG